MSIFNDKQLAHSAGEQKYRAFLLRCWQDEAIKPEGEVVWRFTLVHFDGKQTKKGFARLEELVSYLRAELESGSAAGRRGTAHEEDNLRRLR
jgi:hypothetical protein